MDFKKGNLLYMLSNGKANFEIMKMVQVKIGITNNLNRRIKELQTGCPDELIPQKLYYNRNRESIKRYERILHNYFTKIGRRIRPDGEWFWITEEELRILQNPETTKEINKLMDLILEEM